MVFGLKLAFQTGLVASAFSAVWAATVQQSRSAAAQAAAAAQRSPRPHLLIRLHPASESSSLGFGGGRPSYPSLSAVTGSTRRRAPPAGARSTADQAVSIPTGAISRLANDKGHGR
jgi:hypothetical protein